MRNKPWNFPYIHTLDALADYIRENGFPPTQKQLGERLGISNVAARSHLKVLSSLGYIRIKRYETKGIYLTQKTVQQYHLQDIPFLVE